MKYAFSHAHKYTSELIIAQAKQKQSTRTSYKTTSAILIIIIIINIHQIQIGHYATCVYLLILFFLLSLPSLFFCFWLLLYFFFLLSCEVHVLSSCRHITFKSGERYCTVCSVAVAAAVAIIVDDDVVVARFGEKWNQSGRKTYTNIKTHTS